MTIGSREWRLKRSILSLHADTLTSDMQQCQPAHRLLHGQASPSFALESPTYQSTLLSPAPWLWLQHRRPSSRPHPQPASLLSHLNHPLIKATRSHLQLGFSRSSAAPLLGLPARLSAPCRLLVLFLDQADQRVTPTQGSQTTSSAAWSGYGQVMVRSRSGQASAVAVHRALHSRAR